MPSKKSHRKRKRDGSSRGDGAYDLHLVLPNAASCDTPTKVMVSQLLDRLQSTGYQTVALTHTVYGRPRPADDIASKALPAELWGDRSDVNVIRRLHAVIENLSDLGCYTAESSQDIYHEYDIVSVAPRNDDSFQEACRSATAAEIITLDYSSARGGLPFRIRAADVQAATARGAIFEICYAPSILHKNLRKSIISCCRELQMAGLGTKFRLIMSSGDRVYEERDIGPIALRMPEDIVNIAKTVLQFDGKCSSAVCGEAGLAAIESGQRRRFKDSAAEKVYLYIEGSEKADKVNGVSVQPGRNAIAPVASTERDDDKAKQDLDEENQAEDGFIAF